MMFTAWRKSTYSEGGSQSQCVEVGEAPGRVGVRDTKDRERGHIDVSTRAFRGLVAFAKAQS
jgi:hypothetical protein